MRRPRNVRRRTETLEQRIPTPNRWQTAWNLDALSDEDLEALMPLAEKRAEATPDEPEWTAEEIALMTRLWHKAQGGSEETT